MVSSTPRPHFTHGKDTVPILQKAGWAPRPVWTDGKSRPHRDSILDRPARSQSLYRLSYSAHGNNISRPKNGTKLGTWDLSFKSTICPFLIRMPLCVMTRDVFTNILLSLKPIDAIDSIVFSCFLGKLNFTYQNDVQAQF